MQRLENLPGIPTEKQPKVRRLLLRDDHVNIANMRALMNFDSSDGKAPLCIAAVNKILRDLAIDILHYKIALPFCRTQRHFGQRKPRHMRRGCLQA